LKNWLCRYVKSNSKVASYSYQTILKGRALVRGNEPGDRDDTRPGSQLVQSWLSRLGHGVKDLEIL